MKNVTILFYTLLLTSIPSLAQTTTECPANNPPFQEHLLQALWTESFSGAVGNPISHLASLARRGSVISTNHQLLSDATRCTSTIRRSQIIMR